MSLDKKNLDIMIMFLYKLNNKFNSSRIISTSFSNDIQQILNETFAMKNDFFDIAIRRLGEAPFNEIRNYISLKKSIKDIKQNKLPFYEGFVNIDDFKYDTIDGLNKVLVLVAGIPMYLETNKKIRLDKFKYLAELLYKRNNKYLEMAIETITNKNKNISLNKMVFGVDIELLTNIEKFSNYCKNNTIYVILLLIILLGIYIYLRNNDY